MNGVRTLLNIGEVYGPVLEESKKYVFAPKGTFKTATDKKPVQAKADPKAFTPKNSGPEAAQGFKKDNIIDPEKAKEDNFYTPKKFSQNLEKTEVQTINTFMSKSIFDKLYEDVMSASLKMSKLMTLKHLAFLPAMPVKKVVMFLSPYLVM